MTCDNKYETLDVNDWKCFYAEIITLTIKYFIQVSSFNVSVINYSFQFLFSSFCSSILILTGHNYYN